MRTHPETLPMKELIRARPAKGQSVMVRAKDEYGAHFIPYAVVFDGTLFVTNTGNPLPVKVVEWRAVHPLDRGQRWKPGRLLFRDYRLVA
jgi:hypothetical protein